MCWEVRKDVWGVEKCGEECGRVYGVSGEVCWRVRSGEVWGGVWESVWGEWGSVLACGERMWVEDWERCGEVC